jgi:DivIVA domain-containing protein
MSWSSSQDAGLAERVRRQRFSMAMRGYSPAEVDRFLAQLGDGVERLHSYLPPGGTGMVTGPLPGDLPTAERILRQEFAVVLNGYAMIEVDAFLEEVMDAVGRAWSSLPAPQAPPVLAPQTTAGLPQRLPSPRGSTGFPGARPPALAGRTMPSVPVPLPAPAPPPVVRELQAPLAAGRRELPAPARDTRLDAAMVRSAQFPRAFRGYARKQVDQFLELAADTLERLDTALERAPAFGRPTRPEGLTAADVEASAFFTALRGYAMTQVDDFLDRVAAALSDRDKRFEPAHPNF